VAPREVSSLRIRLGVMLYFLVQVLAGFSVAEPARSSSSS
jgi:hypothetical protein